MNSCSPNQITTLGNNAAGLRAVTHVALRVTQPCSLAASKNSPHCMVSCEFNIEIGILIKILVSEYVRPV